MPPHDPMHSKLQRRVSELDREAGQLAQMVVDREFSMNAAIDLLTCDSGREDEDKIKLAVRVLESGLRPPVETHPVER